MKPSEEDILQRLEERVRQQNQKVRQILVEEGRLDLLAGFDAKMRDIETGVDGAGIIWNALSEAQRRALRFANDYCGGRLVRIGPKNYAASPLIRLATVRNLIARELLACDGGAFDPEKRVVLTEHARFVLKHGPEALSASE